MKKCSSWRRNGSCSKANPVVAVKQTKEPKQRLRFLEPNEVERLLAVCWEPLRTQVLIGFYCGVRLKSEGLTLRREDISFARGTVTVQAAYSKTPSPE